MKGFLLDEHVTHSLKTRIASLAPNIPVYAIGDQGVPLKGTLDPDVLIWLERHDYMLVTNNRASMPVHLKDHFQQGRHIPGVVQLPKQYQINLRVIVDDLVLLWEAIVEDEFQDQIIHLPL